MITEITEGIFTGAVTDLRTVLEKCGEILANGRAREIITRPAANGDIARLRSAFMRFDRLMNHDQGETYTDIVNQARFEQYTWKLTLQEKVVPRFEALIAELESSQLNKNARIYKMAMEELVEGLKVAAAEIPRPVELSPAEAKQAVIDELLETIKAESGALFDAHHSPVTLDANTVEPYYAGQIINF